MSAQMLSTRILSCLVADKHLSLTLALQLLRLPGSRLMEMHDNKAPRGKAYYVIPHGKVDDDDAMKIIARSDVYAFDEGLFPGNPQSWRIA